MMKRIRYTDAPPDVRKALDQSEAVADFLPRPDQLVYKEDNVKVTLELSRRSVSLFKRYARKRGVRYQRMIRNLVDRYAEGSLRNAV
jgi:predicted DNA binding CopG/RHH family protein